MTPATFMPSQATSERMTVKICRDCKYIDSVGCCTHPNAPHSLVTGETTATCEDMRSAHPQADACGPDGDWFEAKEPEYLDRNDIRSRIP